MTEQALPPEAAEIVEAAAEDARAGDTGRLVRYLDLGLPADVATETGDSLVMLAAYHGHAATVRMLIERGADVNRANRNGQTPLAGAVFKQYDDVIRALVDGGADAGAGSPSALEAARMFGRPDLVGLLAAHVRDSGTQA